MTSKSLATGDDHVVRHDYLSQHGEKLLDNGYHIVPIKVGGKAPGYDGWEKSRRTRGQLKEWLENGHKNAGVGILTKETPAVDIDIRDEEVAELMETWVRENLGGTLMRIGKAPKRLFLFRTDKPFKKMRTTLREDEWKDRHQIEVLGDGQQCVVFHKHPETKKPYYWTGDSPLDVEASDLPTIDEEQIKALFAYFEEIADQQEWVIKKAGRGSAGSTHDPDNPYVEDASPVNMTDDEIRARLLLVPNADDHDTWVDVGMALYHQWDGGQPGLQFWHEWAETADNYDADALERRWETFGIGGKKRMPLTVRYILKLSKEAVAKTTVELSLKLRDLFLSAKTVEDWEKARQETREAEIDGLARSSLAQVAKERRDAITGTKTSLVEVKKAIAYSPSKSEKTPGWCKPWVYDISDDRFFHTTEMHSTTQQGFNAMYDRESMTKKDVLDGKHSPTNNASTLALNVHKIKIVNGRRYEPGRDPIFHEPDGIFANTYPEHEIPEIPEKLLPRDKKNVDRVKRHLSHLLSDEKERRMFLDWMCWIVQNPGRHANYAILMQGVEGDGKSFFAELLRAVMGVTNVSMLNAHIFESDFTDWTVGQCVNCVEEVRIVKATNKYEVINRIKPFITNRIIEVHPKGGKVYNAKNTTSYLLFSNYKDALPLTDDGRRYLVLFSQWQRKALLDRFKKENPTYYEELYATIDDSAPALRKWMLEHECSDDFNPMGDAPATKARLFMIKQSKPEFIQELNDLIEEDESLCASEDIVDVTALAEVLMSRGSSMPASKAIGAMMQRDGYEDMGRVRLDGGTRATVYSKNAEMFRRVTNEGFIFDNESIRNYFKKRKKYLEAKDDDL